MQMGRVVGNVVAPHKHDSLIGMKLMIVEWIDPDKKPLHKYEISVDTVSAGVGEYVLVTHGSSARHVFGDIGVAVDSAIVGIIESIET